LAYPSDGDHLLEPFDCPLLSPQGLTSTKGVKEVHALVRDALNQSNNSDGVLPCQDNEGAQTILVSLNSASKSKESLTFCKEIKQAHTGSQQFSSLVFFILDYLSFHEV